MAEQVATGHLASTGAVPAASVHVELSRMLVGREPVSRIVERVAHVGLTAVPEVDEVSITLVQDDGRAETVAFTGPLASQLDERQYERGFGPCLDAARSGRPVRVPDTSREKVYADFARQAARHGVTRVLSVGMPVPGRTVGALNMYVRSGTGFHIDTVLAARAFAEDAAVALANAALYARSAEQVDQMREAMASRALIEQAKGMVMLAQDCTADEAFAILCELAGRSERKLRDIAYELVISHGRDVGTAAPEGDT